MKYQFLHDITLGTVQRALVLVLFMLNLLKVDMILKKCEFKDSMYKDKKRRLLNNVKWCVLGVISRLSMLVQQ